MMSFIVLSPKNYKILDAKIAQEVEPLGNMLILQVEDTPL
jgi:hypothetical protein